MIYLSNIQVHITHNKGAKRSSKKAAPMMANKVIAHYTNITQGGQ